jgi:phenylacetate-coenzyme A ligase PaaK-like adenylate-forming protein
VIIDFSKIPNNDDCFNKENNLDFLAKEHKDFFHIMMEIILIESASKISREKWQLNQLNHLIDYVKTNSEFWRQRIKKDKLSSLEELKEIPILERNDLKTQVDIEGCLLDHNQYVIVEHYSSGSSGVPIKFYNTEFNGKTNSIRSFAIRMANDFNLKDNTTILYASGGASYPGFSTWEDKREDKAGFLDTGIRRVISYNNPDLKLLKQEIKKEPIGNLIAQPYILESLIQVYTPQEMKDDGLTIWTSIGGSAPKYIIKYFEDIDIKTTTVYASEEMGLMGYECNEHKGHLHVLNSNVIVECIPEENLNYGNSTKLGRILITKMSSRATPFIRYDIGDIGELLEECPCGHKGPTIKNLHGRTKSLIRKKDGSVFPFVIQVKNHPFLSNYKEYRFIQTEIDTIRIQIGGISSITEEEVEKWASIVYDQLGKDGINIEIELLDHIDWGGSRKKIPFKSLVI